jgi:formate dehydrogenase iron-sulfur subunit
VTVTVYVSRDASALSLGAEAVARSIREHAQQQRVDLKLIRNGSRGLFWLEPLVEVETSAGRIGYGPVAAKDIAGLFSAKFLEGGAHALRIGVVDELPYLATQQRLTFARVGKIDPLSLESYRASGGYEGLERSLAMSGADVVKAVTDSGLRGRGGAAFPAGIKWKTVLDQPIPQKYVTCNADEGDSGTFADRMLMEGDPFCLIEGMTIAGLAVGATQGYIYLRVEYPHAHATLK